MTESSVSEDKVYTFVLDQIETVPHLEALLLPWNSRPQPWTVENLAKRLYVSTEIVEVLLDDLVRRGLIVCVPGMQTDIATNPHRSHKINYSRRLI